jgi:hypothetical protein
LIFLSVFSQVAITSSTIERNVAMGMEIMCASKSAGAQLNCLRLWT